MHTGAYLTDGLSDISESIDDKFTPSSKYQVSVRVTNEFGLHTRPAAHIVKLLQTAKSDVRITHKDRTADAKSILGILMLGIQKNEEVILTISGIDAAQVMESLKIAFETGFGEEEK